MGPRGPWTERIEHLAKQCRELARALQDVAADLETGRPSFSAELSRHLDAVRKEFDTLSEEIQEAAKERGIESQAPASVEDLARLANAIQEGDERAARQKWVEEREQALELLAKIGRLTHEEKAPFPPLESIKQKADAIRSALERLQWPDVHEEQPALLSGTHPLAALLRIVEQGEQLADDEWTTCGDIIRNAFPRELATAALRGKLAVSHTSPWVEPVAPGRAAAQAWGEVETPPHIATDVTARPVTQEVAPVAPAPAAGQAASDHRSIVWRLVGRSRTAMAYQLARYLEHKQITCTPWVPAWALRAATIGPVLCSSQGELAALLQEDLGHFSEACFESGSADFNWGIRFLLAAACLRPAILAPQTGASAVLRQLHLGELPRLYRYCQRIAEFGELNLPVDPLTLVGLQSVSEWQTAMTELRREAEAWWQQAHTFTVIYAPATRVWRHWLKRGELVERLIRPVLENDETKAQELAQLLRTLSDPKEIDRRIHDTDRRVLRRVAGSPITADARMQLQRRVTEAVTYARRWQDLLSRRDAWSRVDFIRTEIQRLREDLRQLGPQVQTELDEFVRLNADSIAISCSGPACRMGVKAVQDLFDSGEHLTRTEPPVHHLLGIEMLHIPGIRLTEAGEVRWLDEEAAARRLEEIARGATLDWEQTLERLGQEGDHRATRQILDYLQAAGGERFACDVSFLEKKRDESLRQWRLRLLEEIAETRRQLEAGLAHGLLSEGDRERLAGDLEAVQNYAAEALEFHEQYQLLKNIQKQIAERQEQVVRECRQRLEKEVPAHHPEYARLEGLLDQGDVLTANEYIDMVARGEQLPAQEQRRDHFAEFFPGLVRALDDYLNNITVQDLVLRIQQRQSFGGLDLTQITGADAQRAATTVQTWFAAKRQGQCWEKQAQEILLFLGFRGPEVTPIRDQRGRWMKVTTLPLGGREECPVPFYGSSANGEYRILCVWDRPNEETLLQDAGDTSRHPVLIFFFGRLTEHRRRNLARLCRERRRSVLVLDDVLLVYLCSLSGVRLRPFFECSLPFTYAEAYVTATGLVPPEMFYGRQRALASIQDLHGTCFIYGGRQLGKTALLREAERRFHAPNEGRVALYFDLKARSVGTQWPVDDMWRMLDEELTRLQVGRPVQSKPGFETFSQRVKGWLNEDPQRRFLLLLDEADIFLAEDGKQIGGREFLRASQLKGLMEETQRRFKVVLAGLHDVQRTTTVANHPLAHFGVPLCVGPLLEQGEWREARKLIEEPFASLGYRFESPDLVTRILSQTNYYPSLIQLYCQQLFFHLMEHASAHHHWREGPPYTITAKRVEEAYQSQDLRKAIRDRFLLTLQLDKRYEVIAYAIAFEITSAPEAERRRLLSEGFDGPRLQQLARSWWAEGFENARTLESFRALLDEMVGLGVLRYVERGRYALRSPNVVLLLGTNEEIEAKLLEPREPEPRYEPAVMRSPISPAADFRRSPFTWQQESWLLRRPGLFLVVGCEAAALRDCGHRITNLFPARVTQLTGNHGRNELREALRSRRGRPAPVVLVTAEARWGKDWLQEASRLLQSKPPGLEARVLFLCDPRALWELMRQGPQTLQELVGDLGAEVLALGPWGDEMLRVWLEDCEFTANPEQRRKLREVTGNWPLLLYHFHDFACSDRAHWECHLEELKRKIESDSEFRQQLRTAFGMTSQLPVGVLQWVSLQERIAEQDIVDLLGESYSRDQIKLALEWGIRLNLITYATGGDLRLDPVVCVLARDLSG